MAHRGRPVSGAHVDVDAGEGLARERLATDRARGARRGIRLSGAHGRGAVAHREHALIQGVDDRYDIHLDDKYGHSKLIDVATEAAAHDPWFNQTLTTVNDSLVRLGIFEGEFHFHKHDREDEFFFVLEGRLLLDIEGNDTSRSSRSRATRCRRASCIERGRRSARSS